MNQEKISLNIQATGIELTAPIRSVIEKKTVALERHMPNGSHGVLHVEVGLDNNHHKNGDVFIAEFKFDLLGDNFYVKSVLPDLYTAIDDAAHLLIEEVKSKKQKKTALWKRGAQMVKKMMRRN